jgi:hypothetical protein
MPMGPGPGPEAVAGRWGGLSEDDQLVAELRGLYAAFPSQDIARLLDYAERRSGRGIRAPGEPDPNRDQYTPGTYRAMGGDPRTRFSPNGATGGVGGAMGSRNPFDVRLPGNGPRGRSRDGVGAVNMPITEQKYFGPPGVTPEDQGGWDGNA